MAFLTRRNMVSESVAIQAKSGTRSVRTTVPEAICEFLGIQAGDNLEWVMEVTKNGKRVALMSKEGS